MTIANAYCPSKFETQVSNYDRLSALISACIIVGGALLLIFATLLVRESLPPQPPPPKLVPSRTPILSGAFDPDNLVDPGKEVPELQTEIIDLSQFDTDVLSTARAQSALHSVGSNDAIGDGDGRGGGPPTIIPDQPGTESQRWKITYELSDVESYAEQLRFFEIELGLVSENTNDIWRVADVGQRNLVSKSSREKENNSVYFVSTNVRMDRWDGSFALDSEVDSQGCDLNHAIQVHFYPAATVSLLKSLELEAVPADKTIEQVKETNFRLVKKGTGFEFQVTKIKFE